VQLAIQFNVDDKYCILDQKCNRDQSILWFLLLATSSISNCKSSQESWRVSIFMFDQDYREKKY